MEAPSRHRRVASEGVASFHRRKQEKEGGPRSRAWKWKSETNGCHPRGRLPGCHPEAAASTRRGSSGETQA